MVRSPAGTLRYRDREDLKGVAEFIIAKQRSGPTGKRDMTFLAGQQRFEECADDSSGELDDD